MVWSLTAHGGVVLKEFLCDSLFPPLVYFILRACEVSVGAWVRLISMRLASLKWNLSVPIIDLVAA